MQLFLCKSKIHRATLTEANLHYEGSVTIDKNLMDLAQIYPYERVQIVNINNGNRLETYVIEGEAGSGTICLNGAAARKGQAGDLIIIISYAMYEKQEAIGFKPTVVKVDENNVVTDVYNDIAEGVIV